MSLLTEMQADSPNGLWMLDGVDDDSGNSLTLTRSAGADALSIIPTVTTGSSEFFNSVNDYYTRADEALFDLGNTFTIEAWIRVNSYPVGGGSARTVICKGVGAYQMAILDTGKMTFASHSVTEVTRSAATLSLGVTYHVVMVKSGTVNGLVYINGVDDSVDVGDSTMIDTTNSLFIGQTTINNEFWDGKIQAVAIYPTALSAARILAHYNAGAPGPALQVQRSGARW